MPFDFAEIAADGLSDADALHSFGVRMVFAAGEEIYAQDENAEFVYRLLRGAVRTSRLTYDGRRQVGDFYYAGELFGLEAGEAHSYAAEALGACEVLVVKKSALRLYGEEGERFTRLIWAATVNELRRTQKHLFMLGHRTAGEKISHFLLDIAERTGGGPITLPMGRQDIADYLGTTIETVSRTLSQLQADQVLKFDGLRLFRITHRAALERQANI